MHGGLGLRKVRVPKLALILPTGGLYLINLIFDNSEENKILWLARTGPYRPVRAGENSIFHLGYPTLGPYCRPMGRGDRGAKFFVVGLRTIKHEKS
jgi:hypothetical protein